MNVLRHSDGRRVDLLLGRKGRNVRLEVTDDGSGFDPEGPIPEGHLGLQGMRERAELVGGSFDLVTTRGSGTTVTFEVEANT